MSAPRERRTCVPPIRKRSLTLPKGWPTIEPYEITITEHRKSGTFDAHLKDHPDIKCRSTDPEHDIARAIVKAGLPDGPVHFIHGPSAMVSVTAPSVHGLAAGEIKADARRGYRLRRVKTDGEGGRSTLRVHAEVPR